ncbi:hypothetical protein BDV96DRAFT_601406 [Lophiotrema nucula]|uniref:Uncharacterized protein n=1 Tax=Lophiotrema nucula TaxID=690887 RepID=A0A6A5Z184_9PLEO|nr:hypothetical protein BDV96DRAFT_601406 [Lophiotrema nucula]
MALTTRPNFSACLLRVAQAPDSRPPASAHRSSTAEHHDSVCAPSSLGFVVSERQGDQRSSQTRRCLPKPAEHRSSINHQTSFRPSTASKKATPVAPTTNAAERAARLKAPKRTRVLYLKLFLHGPFLEFASRFPVTSIQHRRIQTSIEKRRVQPKKGELDIYVDAKDETAPLADDTKEGPIRLVGSGACAIQLGCYSRSRTSSFTKLTNLVRKERSVFQTSNRVTSRLAPPVDSLHERAVVEKESAPTSEIQELADDMDTGEPEPSYTPKKKGTAVKKKGTAVKKKGVAVKMKATAAKKGKATAARCPTFPRMTARQLAIEKKKTKDEEEEKCRLLVDRAVAGHIFVDPSSGFNLRPSSSSFAPLISNPTLPKNPVFMMKSPEERLLWRNTSLSIRPQATSMRHSTPSFP